ncbi:hypothetical protein DY000_02017580 [Brassica cretica]|uniref:Uncharacterized protein n=1 Tax=Brassica cretica TaxID=69181 RepID=A0ABQ7D7E1_BRACR|nr:hypothetical protein DY000_02017580 [Brassica cretica]
MNFEQPNLSKARLLRLSDDIASNWPRTVHENHPSEHEDRTGCVLLLTAGRAVGCTESGQGLSPSESLSLSRTCVSNQAAIETSGNIIGSSAGLCVTKQSINSLSLQIEFISVDPVECSFFRVLHQCLWREGEICDGGLPDRERHCLSSTGLSPPLLSPVSLSSVAVAGASPSSYSGPRCKGESEEFAGDLLPF